jgi:hypothetical protein
MDIKQTANDTSGQINEDEVTMANLLDEINHIH